MKHLFVIFAASFLLSSCEESKKGKEITVSEIDGDMSILEHGSSCTALPNNAATHFVPLLTDTLKGGVNSVYGVSSLLAWQQLRVLGEGKLNVDNAKYPELARFNANGDYKDALKKGEYVTSVNISDGEDAQHVYVEAHFSAALPFAYKFASYKDKLRFNNKKVAAFGYMNDGKILVDARDSNSDLLYYNNDTDFVLKLRSVDTTHEILLCMWPEKPLTLKEALNTLQANVATFNEMKKSNEYNWKLFLLNEDRILIPKLKFDYKSHHTALEGALFSFGETNLFYRVESFTQCIGFSLDEGGAKVYQEDDVLVTALAFEPEEPQRPKNLFFNKPFLIVLRHIGSDNPYFVAWIENTDFMQVE